MLKRILHGILPGLGVLLLVLDSRTALKSATDGIDLCIRSIIPSIFPFLVLSGMLVAALSGIRFGRLGRLLGIPAGCEGLFALGLLGGYPTGAREVANAWKQGAFSTDDARRMIAFCNNAGPSFLFGILGSVFQEKWMLWLLWAIHILSAVCVGILLPKTGRPATRHYIIEAPTMTDALKHAVATMGYICGWVIFFRMVIGFADRWVLWAAPTSLRVGIYGLFELANGCCSLSLLPTDTQRLVFCSGMLAFGGLCVTMQTASVVGKLGMGIYLPAKILQACISMMLSMLCCYFLFSGNGIDQFLSIIAVGIVGLLTFWCVKRGNMKNRTSIPQAIHV